MKAVLMSIQPKWCELIASGKKTIEVRKTKPKLETPFKVYIYCSQKKRLLHKFNKGERIDDEHYFDEHVFVRQNTWIRGHFNPNGKVIGEFVCDRIDYVRNYGDCVDSYDCIASCLSAKEIIEYATDKNGNFVYTYGWHISDLVIYDEPKELSKFHKPTMPTGLRYENDFITRPPQSWCYVERW